jgi:Brp/Blh family beta-carotene 15,15'-monooxygenase
MFKIFLKKVNKMTKKGWKPVEIRNAMMVSTFFFLWIAIFFGQSAEELLAFVLIFSFGILHGANDLEILRKKSLPAKGRSAGTRILLAYIGFVGLSALLFYVFPLLALILFIIFSAYHFGEQHWIKRKGNNPILQGFIFFSYGMVVLCMLFYAHGPEVASVIEGISGQVLPQVWLSRTLLCSLAVFTVLLFANYYWNQFVRYALREFLLLGLFFVVFQSASLLWAFAIYFVVWHSIPSLADQMRLLYGNLSVQSGIRYVKASAIYWAGALATLAAAFLFFRDSGYGHLPLFFSFLAAITFPHVLVISRLYGDHDNS